MAQRLPSAVQPPQELRVGDVHDRRRRAALEVRRQDRDAFLVGQLREAGAVILGKANLSEWANWMDSCMPNGFRVNGGQTQNPYGPFETYGSSSGSTVSVAADLTTVSVGSETQGSIIAPAGINSVVALKTSRGLVRRDYVIPLLPWQDVPGPMGRTVTDVAVLLSSMTGVDDNDPETTLTAELADSDFTQYLTSAALESLRVGVPIWNDEAFAAYFEANDISDSEQQDQFIAAFEPQLEESRALINTLEEAGILTGEVPESAFLSLALIDFQQALEYGFRDAINLFLTNLGADAPAGSLEEIIAFNEEDLDNRAPYGQDYLESSRDTELTAEEYNQLKEGNQKTARTALDQLFRQYDIDVIASVVGQLYAPAGYPALSVPSGYAEDGMPEGTVFVGPFLSEPQLIAVGYAFEQATLARRAPDLEATLSLIETIATSEAPNDS